MNNLNESLIYAKSIITFIAQKIQNFMEFLPNTLSAILLILVNIGSKVKQFYIFNLLFFFYRIMEFHHFLQHWQIELKGYVQLQILFHQFYIVIIQKILTH